MSRLMQGLVLLILLLFVAIPAHAWQRVAFQQSIEGTDVVFRVTVDNVGSFGAKSGWYVDGIVGLYRLECAPHDQAPKGKPDFYLADPADASIKRLDTKYAKNTVTIRVPLTWLPLHSGYYVEARVINSDGTAGGAFEAPPGYPVEMNGKFSGFVQ